MCINKWMTKNKHKAHLYQYSLVGIKTQPTNAPLRETTITILTSPRSFIVSTLVSLFIMVINMVSIAGYTQESQLPFAVCKG